MGLTILTRSGGSQADPERILGTPENPTGHQKLSKKFNTATFWCTLAAKGRKKEVLEGVWNKHEILIKNRCENGRLWDAKSLIFHWFYKGFVLLAIFEKV